MIDWEDVVVDVAVGLPLVVYGVVRLIAARRSGRPTRRVRLLLLAGLVALAAAGLEITVPRYGWPTWVWLVLLIALIVVGYRYDRADRAKASAPGRPPS